MFVLFYEPMWKKLHNLDDPELNNIEVVNIYSSNSMVIDDSSCRDYSSNRCI